MAKASQKAWVKLARARLRIHSRGFLGMSAGMVKSNTIPIRNRMMCNPRFQQRTVLNGDEWLIV